MNKIEKKNFALYFMGTFMSLFGSSIYTFALGLYVLKTTGSGLSFATTLIMGILPIILINPFAGVIADKFDKGRTIVVSDYLSAFLMVGIFLYTRTNNFNLPIIYLSTFALTSLTQMLSITFEAAKPNLVNDNQIMRINSVGQVVHGVTAIMGPVIGGAIFAFVDIRLFILINGISFALSATSEIFIDYSYNKTEVLDMKKNGLFSDMKEGFDYLFHRNDIVKLFTLFSVTNFVISAAIGVGLPYLLNIDFKLNSSIYGMIQGTFPIGLIIGALFVERVSKKISFDKLIFYSVFIVGLSIILLTIPSLYNAISLPFIIVYYMAIVMIFGIAISLIDIPIMTFIQSTVKDQYRGRVLSMGMSLVKIVNPLAYLITGLMIGNIETWIIIMISGVILLGYLIIFKKDLIQKDSHIAVNNPIN